MALQGLLNNDMTKGIGRVNVLAANFPTVPAALMNIQNSGNDPDVVRANVAVINSFR